MRDKELKKLLQDNVPAPDYIKRDNFIRNNRNGELRHVSTFRLIMQQAGFIRKRVWIASFFLMVIAAYTIFYVMSEPLSETYTEAMRAEAGLFFIATFIPFLASIGMIEAFKAHIHGVLELEQATVISGKRAFFARMTFVGLVNLITIMLIAVLSGFAMGGGILRCAVVFLVLYLLTMILCMELERFEWARKHASSCLIPAIVVYLSIDNFIISWDTRTLLIIFAALIVVQTFEMKRFGMMEELAWN